jgi:hypothetical protein
MPLVDRTDGAVKEAVRIIGLDRWKTGFHFRAKRIAAILDAPQQPAGRVGIGDRKVDDRSRHKRPASTRQYRKAIHDDHQT